MAFFGDKIAFSMNCLNGFLLLVFLNLVAVNGHGMTYDDSALIMVTEELKGYQDVSKGRLQGGKIGDVMLQVVSRLGDDTPILVLPWSRALKVASSRPNTAIFSIVRTPQREKNFIWIKHLLTTFSYAYTTKSSKVAEVRTLDELGPYIISVKRHDAIVELLTQHGFKEGLNLAVTSTNQAALAMLIQGNVDIHTMSPFHLEIECRYLKCKPADFRRLFEVRELRQAFYLAASLGTDKRYIQMLQQTLEAVIGPGPIDH